MTGSERGGERTGPQSELDPRGARSIQDALDLLVLEAMGPAAAGLAVLYAVVSVTSFLIFTPDVAVSMAVISGASALALASLREILARETPEPKMAHPVGAVIVAVVLMNSILLMALTGEAHHTTVLVFLVLAVSIVFLDVGWFASVIAVIFAGWLWTAATVPLSPSTFYPGLSLVAAAALSTAILVIRRRSLSQLEELRFHDRMIHLELEASLARTEAARVGERQAREELEAVVRRLAESKSRFRRLADATLDGVLIHREGRISDASTRIAEMFLWDVDELVGSHFRELVASDDRAAVEAFLAEGEDRGRTIEVNGLRRDGTCFPVEIRNARLGEGGRSEGAGEAGESGDAEAESAESVTVLRDVTDSHRVEEVLRRAVEEAQANDRAKSAFLANMSHELRTPLNSVIGFANVLRKNKDGNLSERDLEFVERIVVNGQHLLDLIGDVLDLSKVESGRIDVLTQPVHLPELIHGAVQTVEVVTRPKGIQVQVEIPRNVEPISSDPHRLRQILLNILGNAAKFTEEGRVVVRVVTEKGGRRPVRLEVADTGIGIPADRLDDIFEAFQQAEDSTSRRFGGTGLGLTIARRIAGILGYTLTVESVEGEGSTFTLHF